MLFTAGVVALSLLFSWLAFQPTPHTGGDNAAYIALGRSLLERHAYLELYDPAQPPHTQYPPVFPAILAAAMAAGLAPWVQLKLIVVAFGAAAVGFSFLWIRRRGRPLLALGVAILLALAPGVLTESHWILSDVPFWCFTVAALWAFERLPPAARGRYPPRATYVARGARYAFGVACVVIAYFTRSAGLPLALAALAWLGWRRRWKQLAILAGVFLPLAFGWWLRARSLGGVDYVSQFLLLDPYSPALGHIGITDLVQRAGENAVNYVHIHLPRLLVGRAARWLDPPSLLLLVLAAVGWARSMRRPGVPELFLPLYLGLLVVWPAVWSGERFLLPALPLLLFYAGDVIVRVATRLDRRSGIVVGAAVCALILAAAVPALDLAIRNGKACREAYRAGDTYPCLPGEAWHEFFRVAEATGHALPDGAAVISRKPRLFYALSGLPGRIYPFSADADTFFAFADTSRTRYLVFDGLGRTSQAYVRPILVRRPAAFCALFAAPGGTALFGIRPDANEIADAPPDARVPRFEPCEIEYWRSQEARSAVIGGR